MSGRRTWIKMYVGKWLRGTLREETPEFRGIFADILCLAGDSAYGDVGEIKITDTTGLSDEQIAHIIHAPLQTWLDNKARMVETKRIEVLENNIIKISKWKAYQSEYSRQKTYRHNPPKFHPKTEKVTPESYDEKLHGEREGERDKNVLEFLSGIWEELFEAKHGTKYNGRSGDMYALHDLVSLLSANSLSWQEICSQFRARAEIAIRRNIQTISGFCKLWDKMSPRKKSKFYEA